MDTIFRLIYKHRTFVKFAISGSLSAGTDLFILYVLYGVLKVNLAIAASISFAGAFVVSFIFHKFWTFRNPDKKRIPVQMTSYFLIAFVNMTINANAVVYLVDSLGVYYLYAQMIAGAVLSVVTFSALRFVIFRRRKKESLAETDEAERPVIVLDLSVEKAAALAASLGRAIKDFEIVPYSGYACRLNCPATRLYSLVRFFNDVYQLSKRRKVFYCLDAKKTGLALAVVKSMRPEVSVYCTEGEMESMRKEGIFSEFVCSKLQRITHNS